MAVVTTSNGREKVGDGNGCGYNKQWTRRSWRRKWLRLQQAMDEKKLATKHVSTESNVADIGTKVFTSDRIWKLMNLMGMSLVAGVECLVQQPMETNTWTSNPDRETCTIHAVMIKPEREMIQVKKATAPKPWRGLRAETCTVPMKW